MRRGEARRSGFLRAALVAALAGAAPATLAQDAGDDPRASLDAVERALGEREQREAALVGEADALAGQIAAARAQLIATAAAVQAHESRLAANEAELADIEARQAVAEASHERHRAGLESALAALTLLARSPPNALLGRPADWAETVRGVTLLERLLPELQDRAEALADQLEALASLRTAHAHVRANIADATVLLSAERARLRGLLERKSSLQAAIMAERRRLATEIADLAAEADDLKTLVERIAAERAQAEPRLLEAPSPAALAEPEMGAGLAPQLLLPRPPGAGSEAAPAPRLAALPASPEVPTPAGSSLPFPVHGDIVEHFGDPLDGGGASLGIRIRVRHGAQVVAPLAGEVVFAGPFRSYGQLLILEHAGGYHGLMAGFSRIDAEVGQWVRAGEPVGSVANTTAGPIFLYIEIRRDSEPIDPVPWLSSGERKVSG